MRAYLDHNAGSPLRPAARRAIDALLARVEHGNPASIHHAGQAARRDLERAREQVASLIAADPRTIVFTSGGAEANNLAIFGAAQNPGDRRRIVTTAIEHSSILEPLIELERRGFEVIRLAPNHDGLIDPADAVAQIDRHTALVTIGLVNAEIGAIHLLDGIADTAHRAGALFHLDAAQALGRLPLDPVALGCDLMTLSGHKIGAPAGIGALYVAAGAVLSPYLLGGPQESARRAGTPNLLGAVAFGAAAEEVAHATLEASRIARLAHDLFSHLMAEIPALRLNGPVERRVANTLNLCFPAVLGETMLLALDLEGVAVSMGSACAAGAVEPSHVLLAMGRSAAEARSSIRLSLGWSTTPEEIAFACQAIPRVWRRVAACEPTLGATIAS